VASLRARISLLGSIVLAVGLAVTAVLTFELIQYTRESDLKSDFIAEQRDLKRSLSSLIAEAGGGEGSTPDTATLRVAAVRYFRLNPGVDDYLTIVRVGDAVVTSKQGPDMVQRLQELGEIPQNRLPGLATLATPLGEILSLRAPLPVAGGTSASLQIVAPIAPIRAEAFRALLWLGVASAGSLVLGYLLLTWILRRALSPLDALASAAGEAELENLTFRVPEPKRSDEIGVLTREFNRMLVRLEEAAAGQRKFMATASHELRTPVTIARGHIELLQSVGVEDARIRAETVELVKKELVRMQRLVDDLMAVARSSAEGFVVMRPLSLRAFFEDLELRLAGLDMRSVSLAPVPELTIEADGERLAQAVLNLVVNAVVHTPEGTHVEVGAREDGDAVAIFVRDDGPGIDPAIRDTMFVPFVKGGSADQSSGLGLAVVAAIVEAHDGTVRVETGERGTTFTIRISTRRSSGAAPTGVRALLGQIGA
jgi:two-component system OmpR family sensor kinase